MVFTHTPGSKCETRGPWYHALAAMPSPIVTTEEPYMSFQRSYGGILHEISHSRLNWGISLGKVPSKYTTEFLQGYCVPN